MNFFLRLSLALAVIHGAPLLRATTLDLYGVAAIDGQLFSINPQSGAGTLVGALGTSGTPYGIASLNGTLYTFDAGTDQIRPINPITGAAGAGIDIKVGGISGEGELTFRSDGIGFLATVFDPNQNPLNGLYSFDISKGTSTFIGSTGRPIDGLAFDGATLYALGQTDQMLYTVNPSNASLTPIGSIGVDHNSPFAGLATGPNGVLYAAIDDRLYTLDKGTGAASPVDPNVLDFGFSSVSGIAFQSRSVPEGGSMMLPFLAATIGLAAARHLSKKRVIEPVS
ncbi:MAG: hypothetical protein U1G07_20090 [Verrucomicrobiota bacterium]